MSFSSWSSRRTLFSLPRSQRSSNPQFSTGVDLVEVDVTVLDKNGKPVTDLRAADFEVRERGDCSASTRSFSSRPMARSRRRRRGGPSGFAPSGPADAAVAGPLQPRVFIFVFDMAHLSAAGFDRSRTAIRSFLGDGLRADDLAGLVVNGNMLGNRIVSDKEHS